MNTPRCKQGKRVRAFLTDKNLDCISKLGNQTILNTKTIISASVTVCNKTRAFKAKTKGKCCTEEYHNVSAFVCRKDTC